MAVFETIHSLPNHNEFRSARVGQLFNIRRHQLLPNSLWDEGDLADDRLLVEESPFTNYSVSLSDTLQERMDMMGVNASITAKMLFISVSIDAKYLYEKNTSSRHTSVTARFSTTSKTKKLTSWHMKLENIKYPEVNQQATHVISGIKYGANAFFKFETEYKKSQAHHETSGSLSKVVSAIPGLKGSSSERPEVLKQVKYSYFGDFSDPRALASKDDSYEEGVSMIKAITEKDNQHEDVPVTLFLTPLHHMNIPLPQNQEAIVELSCKLQHEILALKQDMNRTQEELQSIRKSKTAECFVDFNAAVVKLMALFEGENAKFMDSMKTNKDDEIFLVKEIDEFQKSIFGRNHSMPWIAKLLDEVDAMDAFIETTENKAITVTFGSSGTRGLSIKNSQNKMVLAKVDFVSMLDDTKQYPEITTNWLTKAGDNFFADLIHTVNLMARAAKINSDSTQFVVQVNYMTKEGGMIRENMVCLESRQGVASPFSPLEASFLHPSLGQLVIQNNTITFSSGSNITDQNVLYKFKTHLSTGAEEIKEIVTKGKAIELDDEIFDLESGTIYEVSARFKSKITELLGPWCEAKMVKTHIRIKDMKSSSVQDDNSLSWGPLLLLETMGTFISKREDSPWLEVELDGSQTISQLALLATGSHKIRIGVCGGESDGKYKKEYPNTVPLCCRRKGHRGCGRKSP